MNPVRGSGQPAFAHRTPNVGERVRVGALTGPANHGRMRLVVRDILEADAPFATSDEALGDSRPEAPGRAEDQVLHSRLLQPLTTSSANRF